MSHIFFLIILLGFEDMAFISIKSVNKMFVFTTDYYSIFYR